MKILSGLNGPKNSVWVYSNACYNRYQCEVIEDVTSDANYTSWTKKKSSYFTTDVVC